MINEFSGTNQSNQNDMISKRFDEISNVVRGASPRPAGDPKFFKGNFIPWLTVASLTSIPDSQIEVVETDGFLTEDGSKFSRQLEKGTLILSNSGATLGVAKLLGIKCCANDGIAAFTDWDESLVDKHYALYFLNSMTKYFRDVVAPGNGQPNLNTELIGTTRISFPPLPEQKAIASVFSLMDSAINKTNQLITQKESQKKALMQLLMTGKKRLKGFAEAWNEIQLGEVFKEITDTNDGGDTHSIMTISSRLGLISQEDKFDRVIAGDSLKKYTQLKREDFAYNKGNSKTYQMGCVYQLEDKDSALVPFVYICFSPGKEVHSTFYKQWFSAHGLDRQLRRIITSGARGDGLLNVDTEDFFKLSVPLPTMKEQVAIARVLQTADREIGLLKSKAERLRKQKKGMMQVLLAGKKRLKGFRQ